MSHPISVDQLCSPSLSLSRTPRWPPPDPPAATPAPGSAGSTEYCNGVFVYHDYVYDDYGAIAGDPNAAPRERSRAPTATSATRPTSTRPTSSRCACRSSAGQLHVSFELNTLRDANSTVAALAIDTDNDAATGAALGTGVGRTCAPSSSRTAPARAASRSARRAGRKSTCSRPATRRRTGSRA